MRREILALTEGDAVLLLPYRLGSRSHRQLKAWLSGIMRDLDAADRVAKQRSTAAGEKHEHSPIGSVAAS